MVSVFQNDAASVREPYDASVLATARLDVFILVDGIAKIWMTLTMGFHFHLGQS